MKREHFFRYGLFASEWRDSFAAAPKRAQLKERLGQARAAFNCSSLLSLRIIKGRLCHYGTEALRIAIGYCFDHGFREVMTGAFEENLASIRIMMKNGMQKLDRQDWIAYRGKTHMCVYYSICRNQQTCK